MYTAISKKVVGKSARDNLERYCGWFWVHCFSKKFERMAREAMDVCLRVLKESNKSRFDSYSVRKSALIISHIAFRDCRMQFEFMINTAPLASNSVYGREKLFWYDKITFPKHVCHCGAVIKELRAPAEVLQINRVRLPATLFSVSLYYSFFLFGLSFFKHYFSFWPFFLYSYCWPCWSSTWINIDILRSSPEFYFGKGISKALDLHTGQAYDQIKTIGCQDIPPLNSWIFFNFSWHHGKQHTVHHKLY